MKRMLFNATHPEEMRVALVDGQRLLDLDIESTASNQKKGNIYKARVTRIEPSLEAAFVDYGSERQGFLPLKEVARLYFSESAKDKAIHKVGIADALQEGQEILVQIEKEERGNKGAALTTFISLAGRFIVLMPNNPKGGGISRRIAGEEREQMREIINNLNLPESHSVILRTAGMGRSEEEIQWDYDFLMKLWQAIESAAQLEEAPKLIYQDSSLVVRALRDYLRDDVKEVIIDDAAVYERALKFVNLVMPERNARIKLYEETIPLLARYQVEQQIEAAFSREIRLPSGGAIVIDHTEAVVTIDVNSAKSTKGSDIEDTALHTNMEAAEEIARQLKIRDIGGLIVIDFIDMQNSKNQRKIEQTLVSLVKTDRARIQIGKISRFGLLEMSRQRIRGALVESNYHTCPRCNGNGIIRGVVSSALSILRIIEEESLKENTEAILVHLPVETATYLLNEKRYDLALMERRLATRITIVPNSQLETPYFKIERLRGEEYGQIAHIPSHRIELDDTSITKPNNIRPVMLEVAAVQMDEVTESIAPAPVNTNRSNQSASQSRSSQSNARENTNTAAAEGPRTQASREEKGVFSFVTRLFGGGKKQEESVTSAKSDLSDSGSKQQSAPDSNSRANQRHNNNNRNRRAGGPNQNQQRNNRNDNRQRPQRKNPQNGQQENRQNDRQQADSANNGINTNDQSTGNEQQNRSSRNRRAHYSRQRGRGRGANNRNNQSNNANSENNDALDNANQLQADGNTNRSAGKPVGKPVGRPDSRSSNKSVTNDKDSIENKNARADGSSNEPVSSEQNSERPRSSGNRADSQAKKANTSQNASDSASKEQSDAKATSEQPKQSDKPKRTRKAPAKKQSSSDSGETQTGTSEETKPKTTRRRSTAKKSEDGDNKAPAKRRSPAKKASASTDADGNTVKKAPAKRRAPAKRNPEGDSAATSAKSSESGSGSSSKSQNESTSKSAGDVPTPSSDS